MKRILAAIAACCLAAPAIAAPIPANVLQSSVASVSAVTSTSGVMAGLGATAPQFTPKYDGVALIQISGTLVFGATANTGIVQIRYGTGAGPSNAGTATGTACGPTIAPVSLTGILTQMISMQCIATGMAIGTPYWVDALLGSSGSTAQLTNVSVSVVEQ